ncbi:hypothetical protein BDV95DRAFT_611899 [Massariosphaeria phaeospora]|uniref:C2H2-type domain-containing protein n=1 Tax=Massariosphaeria phaeospora TaxID=100035 RepID=A0A7C8I159_9PLEO|nr:hypothetical protein BDV95DRAFT_611899 [Massariosphaeria phaeospora]
MSTNSAHDAIPYPPFPDVEDAPSRSSITTHIAPRPRPIAAAPVRVPAVPAPRFNPVPVPSQRNAVPSQRSHDGRSPFTFLPPRIAPPGPPPTPPPPRADQNPAFAPAVQALGFGPPNQPPGLNSANPALHFRPLRKSRPVPPPQFAPGPAQPLQLAPAQPPPQRVTAQIPQTAALSPRLSQPQAPPQASPRATRHAPQQSAQQAPPQAAPQPFPRAPLQTILQAVPATALLTAPTPSLLSVPTPPLSTSPLHTIPRDIATHRKLLFSLDTTVQLYPAAWDRFWPFIDNVWCVHQTPRPSPETGIGRVYGSCRLSRKNDSPPLDQNGDSQPRRQRRERGTCKAKFRLTLFPDGLRMAESTGEPHSHTLDHIDSVKRPSAVRNLVLNDFFKSWEAAGILAYLRDISAQDPKQDLLKEAGGFYLTQKEVQNVMNGALKKAYPGVHIADVRKQMDKYKNWTTCNHKGCNAPPFKERKALLDHRKAVHRVKKPIPGELIHQCPEKTCWRHKRKGFDTMKAVEEHMRKKHNADVYNRPLPQQLVEPSPTAGTDPLEPIDLTSRLSPMMRHSMNVQHNGMPNMDPFTSMLPDPITPDSSGEDRDQRQQQQQNAMRYAAQQEARSALSALDREDMKTKIERLKAERERMDSELRRLNVAFWGDERGEGEAMDEDEDDEDDEDEDEDMEDEEEDDDDEY